MTRTFPQRSPLRPLAHSTTSAVSRLPGSRAAWGILAAVLLLVVPPVLSADAVDSSHDAEDVQDILFCAPRRPFLIRLRLSVDGNGFRSLRRQWADAQFAALDADGNGLLEGEELKRLPTPAGLRPGMAVESAKSLQADADPADGKVTPAECRRYLLAAAGTPFSLLTQTNGGGLVILNDNLNAQVNLLPKLDTDQDGKLSTKEISAAQARLLRYDRNEDDAIDALELQQGLTDEVAAAQQRLSGVIGMLIVVDTSDQGLIMSRRLLESYDKASRDPVARIFRRDERLSRTELPIEADVFDRADRNADGKLDRAELGLLSSAMTPSVELAIDAPSASGEYSLRSLRDADKSHAAHLGLKQDANRRQTLVLGDTSLALSAAGPVVDVEQQLRNTYRQQFQNLDLDKNDYLDRPEMQRFGFQDAFFSQADADQDGKLFESEYQAQIEREIELSKTGIVLEVGGDGRSLFRLIDVNPADGRLTLRELADASEKLMQWDANGDGSITQAELSISLNAVFRTGTPRVNGPFRVAANVSDISRNPTSQSGPQLSAKSWFFKMDRNGDGDLSPKEFLGRRALFDKIDQNRDGLISPDEAEAAHRDALGPAPP